MKGSPLTKSMLAEQSNAILKSADEVAKQLEEKWGWGRLPTLVEPEWAAKLASALFKFNESLNSPDIAEIQKYGDALIRGYHKIEALAIEAGHEPKPVTQWEFEGPDGPIILVQDSRDIGRADRAGRQCQVWSLEELGKVLVALKADSPVLEAAKAHFFGAVVESVRPLSNKKTEMIDDDIPF